MKLITLCLVALVVVAPTEAAAVCVLEVAPVLAPVDAGALTAGVAPFTVPVSVPVLGGVELPVAGAAGAVVTGEVPVGDPVVLGDVELAGVPGTVPGVVVPGAVPGAEPVVFADVLPVGVAVAGSGPLAVELLFGFVADELLSAVYSRLSGSSRSEIGIPLPEPLAFAVALAPCVAAAGALPWASLETIGRR